MKFVRSDNKKWLRLTPTDPDEPMVWLARTIEGERSRKASLELQCQAMLWAMVNRYLLHPGHKHWPDFVYMLRRFSQPINPRWMRGGDLAEKHAGEDSVSEARLNRREEICAMHWDDIHEDICYAVTMFCRGELPPPLHVTGDRKISNWASYPKVRERYPQGVDIGGNWFIEDPELDIETVVIDYWG